MLSVCFIINASTSEEIVFEDGGVRAELICLLWSILAAPC